MFSLNRKWIGHGSEFRQNEKVLHVRLIVHYICAKFQTCTYNMQNYRFTEDQRKFREKFGKKRYFFDLDLE